jgi:hypothetical protein
MDRRDFLSLAAAGGGAVFASGIAGCAGRAGVRAGTSNDFYFVQLSDTHWGYQGPANPEAAVTLRRAVAAVNALPTGMAYKELFGDTFYTFDHKGVHFIAIDNVSDPGAQIGGEQLAWLRADLSKRNKTDPIVVLTHRPLFDLAPKWDWATRDGAQALELLMPLENVTVFYGHIHQEHHHTTGHIAHHSAKSLIFPLPAPGSQPNRTPLPWDANAPYQGLGFREIEAEDEGKVYRLAEFPVVRT